MKRIPLDVGRGIKKASCSAASLLWSHICRETKSLVNNHKNCLLNKHVFFSIKKQEDA